MKVYMQWVQDKRASEMNEQMGIQPSMDDIFGDINGK